VSRRREAAKLNCRQVRTKSELENARQSRVVFPCITMYYFVLWEPRDRSYLLNEAVENFISEQKRFAAMVEEGLEASRNGELIDHEEVAAMVETWEGERAETEVGARARA